MPRTRLTLLYPVGYLAIAGFGFLLAPKLSLSLLFSNGDYGEVFPRLGGMLLLGIGLIVAQVFHYRVEVLYPTILFVRVFFLFVLATLYFANGNPAFLVIFVIVAIGVVLTGFALLAELRRARSVD